MSAEARRQEQDITVYRCDHVEASARCVRETASFRVQDTVTVLLDPAWLMLRAGLDEEKHFCSWEHHIAWVQAQETQGGAFATRLRTASQTRERRETQDAEMTRERQAQRQVSGALLDAPVPTA